MRADLLAGLTRAVVVLPQGMAFATLAGLPARYGLYAAMLPCIAAGPVRFEPPDGRRAGQRHLTDDDGLIAPLAAVGSPEYMRLVLTLTFLVGAMQLLLGMVRVGAVVDKVPHSVIVGFTAGAAILIVNGQPGTLLGREVLVTPAATALHIEHRIAYLAPA